MNQVDEIMELAKANSDLWPGQVAVYEISPKSEIIDQGVMDAPSFAEHWGKEMGIRGLLDGKALPDDWAHKKMVGILHDGGMALYVIPPRVADDGGDDDE